MLAKKMFLGILGLLLPSMVAGQVVIWEMKPMACSSLSRLTSNLFVLEENGKKGVVDSKGNVVVEPFCSDIRPFYDGMALLTQREGGKERVVGCLDIGGRCNLFAKAFYAIKGQEFYSDGLLTVEDENGVKGYVDAKGNELAEIFSAGYDEIKPFCEGYAAVFKDKRYALIDKSGNLERIIMEVGEVIGGTNVYQGEAYVWNRNGIYVYDVRTKEPCKKSKRKFGKVNAEDYLYRFAAVTGLGKDVPYDQVPKGSSGPQPIFESGKYGYAVGGSIILPPQFDYATPFEGSLAIVKTNGKYGILRMVESGSQIALSVAKSHVDYFEGTDADCSFHIHMPIIWQGKELEAVVMSCGVPLRVRTDGSTCTFSCKPTADEQSFDVEVSADGLVMLRQSLSYSFVRMLPLEIDISIPQPTADKDGTADVVVRVVNRNNIALKTKVEVCGTGISHGGQHATIPANGHVVVKSKIAGINSARSQMVTVRTALGAQKSQTFHLQPYTVKSTDKDSSKPVKKPTVGISIDDVIR